MAERTPRARAPAVPTVPEDALVAHFHLPRPNTANLGDAIDKFLSQGPLDPQDILAFSRRVGVDLHDRTVVKEIELLEHPTPRKARDWANVGDKGLSFGVKTPLISSRDQHNLANERRVERRFGRGVFKPMEEEDPFANEMEYFLKGISDGQVPESRPQSSVMAYASEAPGGQSSLGDNLSPTRNKQVRIHEDSEWTYRPSDGEESPQRWGAVGGDGGPVGLIRAVSMRERDREGGSSLPPRPVHSDIPACEEEEGGDNGEVVQMFPGPRAGRRAIGRISSEQGQGQGYDRESMGPSYLEDWDSDLWDTDSDSERLREDEEEAAFEKGELSNLKELMAQEEFCDPDGTHAKSAQLTRSLRERLMQVRTDYSKVPLVDAAEEAPRGRRGGAGAGDQLFGGRLQLTAEGAVRQHILGKYQKVLEEDMTGEGPSDAARPFSVATSYLRACHKQQVQPQAGLLFVERGASTRVLDAASQGLSDKAVMALAASVGGNKKLTGVDLRENKIRQKGIAEVCKALLDHGRIHQIDLSRNGIGRPLGAIAGVVQASEHLVTLRLAGNDMGDPSTVALCDAVAASACPLIELDLSSNKIHNSGALAVGRMLAAPNSRLRILSLAWNGIAGRGAMGLVNGMVRHRKLQVLRLGWNGFGDERAGEFLARWLEVNTCLRELDLSFNRIRERAAVVFSQALIRNRALRSLELAGNPIGLVGASSLLEGLQYRTPSVTALYGEIRLGLRECTFPGRSAESLYDPLEPHGEYTLDLAQPYDRTVAQRLVYLTPPPHPLAQPYDRTVAQRLVHLAHARQSQSGFSAQLLLGPSRANRKPKRFPLPASHQGIPRSGQLSVKFSLVKRPPDERNEVAKEAFVTRAEELIKNAVTGAEVESIMQVATTTLYLTAEQLLRLVQHAPTPDTRARAIARCWGRVVDVENLRRMMVDDPRCGPQVAIAVEEAIPHQFHFYPLLPGGQYILDLAVPSQRAVALQLQQVANVERLGRTRGGWCDVSHLGDFETWRNVTHRGQPLEKAFRSATWDVPLRGLLELDYTSCTRPPAGAQAMTVQEFLLFKRMFEGARTKGRNASNMLTLIGLAGSKQTARRSSAGGLAGAAAAGANVGALASGRWGAAVNKIEAARATREGRRYWMSWLRLAATQYYFTAQQAAEIVETTCKALWPRGPFDEAKERIGHVDLAHALHSRVVDVENYHQELRVRLPGRDISELGRAVGWLALFNPERPDGHYKLHLNRWDERMMARMLTDLYVKEGHQTWLGAAFNGRPFMVPKYWPINDCNGVPDDGVLELTFKSIDMHVAPATRARWRLHTLATARPLGPGDGINNMQVAVTPRRLVKMGGGGNPGTFRRTEAEVSVEAELREHSHAVAYSYHASGSGTPRAPRTPRSGANTPRSGANTPRPGSTSRALGRAATSRNNVSHSARDLQRRSSSVMLAQGPFDSSESTMRETTIKFVE